MPTGPWSVAAGVSRDFASLNRTSEAVAGLFWILASLLVLLISVEKVIKLVQASTSYR